MRLFELEIFGGQGGFIALIQANDCKNVSLRKRRAVQLGHEVSER